MTEDSLPAAEPGVDDPDDRHLPEPAAQASDAAPPAPEVVADLESRLLRALADRDNLRKRYERELASGRAAERARAAREWLPVVDNLELALQHTDADARALIDGIRAVADQAIAVLARLGFPRFEDVGEPFDPARHEAVSMVPADAPPRTVVAAVRPGYGTSDDVLRPAGVVVARSSE